MNNPPNTLSKISVIWALIGFIGILGFAIYRLFNHFLDALNYPWSVVQWLLLILFTAFMAYTEGYKGFQKSYSLKFSRRANSLTKDAPLTHKLLAPFFCMNYFAAEKKAMKLAYILTIMIIGLVVVFSYIPQPWRGILDIGVVVGLTWGLVATVIICFQQVLFSKKSTEA